MRIAADNKKFFDVYAKANEEVIQEDQQTKKEEGLFPDKLAPLLRSIKGEKLRNSTLEQAIKLLNHQNMQMKSRIKELESAIENHKTIICDKETPEDPLKQRDSFAENIEQIRLKRQLMQRKKDIESLTAQLVSTREELKLIRSEKRDICKREIPSGSREDIELQVKLCSLENQVAEYERENKYLFESNEKILQSLTAWESDLKMMSLLLDKLQHLECEMSASEGDRVKQCEEMRQTRNTPQTQARSVEARTEALSRRVEGNQSSRNLQELCESFGLDVKDLEVALIQMSGQREYPAGGTDTDAHTRTSKTPQNEGTVVYDSSTDQPSDGECARRGSRELRMTEDHQRAVGDATNHFDLTQICTDMRLPGPESSKVVELDLQLAPSITRSLPGGSSFEEGKNFLRSTWMRLT
ncbi:hypothetical protein TcWFU_005630 [Taenia crassiceps]|uniref:Uncharacterized protein n=1 Tax=Taenia crassiceps TaxID=6207 RepID=A0ABR4QB51_9CEST